MKNQLLFLFVSVFLIGISSIFIQCSGDKYDENRICLSVSVKNEAIKIVPDTIKFKNEYIYANRFFVYNDTLLIVINKASQAVPFVEIRDIRSEKLIKGLITHGNGPGEMLQVSVNVNHGTLIVEDIQKKSVAFIEIDSLLIDPNYTINFERYKNRCGGINKDLGGNLLFENPYYFETTKLDINNDVNRFFHESDNIEGFELGMNTSNVTYGRIITNPSRGKIVYLSLYYPVIEFYNRELELSKTIIGPDDFSEQDFSIIQSEENIPEVIFKKTIPYAYIAFSDSDDFFYVSYVGEMLESRQIRRREMKSYIFKYDWDGDLVEAYSTDQYLCTLSCNDRNDFIYASSYDSDGLPILLKYELGER